MTASAYIQRFICTENQRDLLPSLFN